MLFNCIFKNYVDKFVDKRCLWPVSYSIVVNGLFSIITFHQLLCYFVGEEIKNVKGSVATIFFLDST